MALSLIRCSKCSTAVFPNNLNDALFEPCPSCQSLLAVDIFPAILKSPAAVVSQRNLIEGESSCFYHPEKTATMICQSCGRFLCALCDLEVEGRHICPRCFESGLSAHEIETAEPRRIMYDTVALALSTLPALLFWPAPTV